MNQIEVTKEIKEMEAETESSGDDLLNDDANLKRKWEKSPVGFHASVSFVRRHRQWKRMHIAKIVQEMMESLKSLAVENVYLRAKYENLDSECGSTNFMSFKRIKEKKI